MKIRNAIIPLITLLLLFSVIAPAFAVFSGTLSIKFNKETAKVGDTVDISVQASNDGLGDWTNLKIYAPIPQGLQYVSHVMPDRTVQEYDPSTGIWNVYQMRDTNRGTMKQMIITCKVLPSASGKTITATTKIYSLMWRGQSMFDLPIEYQIPTGRTSPGLTVDEYDPPKNRTPPDPPKDPGAGPGAGPGSGGSNGNGTGVGNQNETNYGNAVFASAVENMTASNNKDPLLNSRKTGGGGNQKKYEVFEDLNKTDSRYVYVLAALLIIGLIIIGYYYGIKKED